MTSHALLERGDQSFRKGDYADAASAYRAALAQDPSRAKSHAALAASLMKLGDLTGAHHAYEAAFLLEPGSSTYQFALAKAAYLAGDYGVAHRHFAAISAREPDNEVVQRYLLFASGLTPDFEQRLKEAQPRVTSRLFLTGCGRSGTWLVTAMMMGLKNLRAASGEQPIGAFLTLPNAPEIHLVKRASNAYLHYDHIPASIKVIHVVRHPYDVLSSKHLSVENFVSPARLEAWHQAFLDHLRHRPGTLTLRYEDVVAKPEETQARVEDFVGTPATRPFSEFWRDAKLPSVVVEAMHGLRPLDTSRLENWRTTPELAADQRKKLAQQGPATAEVMRLFGYDVA